MVRGAAVALSLMTASLISFPSFSTTGAGLTATPPVAVNRALKGDRLPASSAVAPAFPAKSESRARVPVGCDNAFSSISSPRLANVFRRCMA
jgi:hypothetical protein